jgi:hypothetical protein
VIDEQPRVWPDWLGGVALVSPLAVAVALATYGSGHSMVDRVAAVGIIVSEVLMQAVIAPLVGYRRRYVLWCLLPFWGWVIAWRLGTRLGRLCRTGSRAVRDTSVSAFH